MGILVTISKPLGRSELRLLNRLAIAPSMRQSNLARELNVTRSAINQLWTKLEREYGLAIRGNLDLGRFGLRLMFGWAQASGMSDILMKFSRWLKSNSLVTRLTKSMMSSTLEEMVYFEAIFLSLVGGVWLMPHLQATQRRISLVLPVKCVLSIFLKSAIPGIWMLME